MLRSDAKTMLEHYQGYYEGHNWDSEKQQYREFTYKGGLIQKLASEAQKLKESSNLGERFGNRTFGNFDPRRDKQAFDLCRAYANDTEIFSKKRNGLMLLGGVGSGKTHLAASIANVLIDRGVPTLFGTYSEHLEKIREEFDSTGKKQYMSKMKNTPLIVLDDIGKERKTDWTQSVLFDIINYRYEHLLPVILTTNFDADGLANYVEAAVWSRLYETCSAVMTKGDDYRQ